MTSRQRRHRVVGVWSISANQAHEQRQGRARPSRRARPGQALPSSRRTAGTSLRNGRIGAYGKLTRPSAPGRKPLEPSRGADGGTRTHTPLRRADFLTTSAFAAAQERRSWSGLSLRPSSMAVGAARPVSTPSLARAWLGIGLGRPLAFPDFERFCSTSFPAGTPIEVCCVYRFRHVRVSL
jgi:hypothetical protein